VNPHVILDTAKIFIILQSLYRERMTGYPEVRPREIVTSGLPTIRELSQNGSN
jgi:hypothetical protein